jgi:hypothetical protein
VLYSAGDVQGVNGSLSSLHETAASSFTVNVKLADWLLLGSLGRCWSVTTGAVPSTRMLGWEPVRANASAPRRSSVTQVWEPSVGGDVAENVSVSVPPWQRRLFVWFGFPSGRLRLIFPSAIRAPSATHAEATQLPAALVVACTVVASTAKSAGIAIFARSASFVEVPLFVSVTV